MPSDKFICSTVWKSELGRFGNSSQFCVCELPDCPRLLISHRTGHIHDSENHLLCRFTRSSGCLSFPGTLLHSGWLPVSPRYRSEEKTAWNGPRSSATQRSSAQKPTSHMLLGFASTLHWFVNKMVRHTVFATTVRSVIEQQLTRYQKIRNICTEKQDSLSFSLFLWHTVISSHSRHKCDPTNSVWVITADTARAGAWRMCSSETGKTTAYSLQRPEAMVCYSLCLSSAVDTEDRPVTSHKATRGDSQTLIH